MPPRNRTPMYSGEGLDRESGLMVVRPVDFRDLRNVLLHEGQMQLRPGFLAKGEGLFEEVDRLVAGFPLKSDGLGIVVGYNSSTERVYVYRVAPNVALVELLGEWVHDLAVGWGAATPRIIMCEVGGRVFMAHDESRVTRRAPTLYYDPITGEQLLNYLTATFAGTTLESGESGGESVVVVPNAIRFRGVVRHLQYLVGWGFGTATEIRPELVRISLPGEPLTFDENHYFVAGDRRNPVLACGPSGDVDGAAAVLTVWKGSETHAIIGYDRATFGIRLIDPRHGIVASRAWVNIEGIAVAWAEEGPRLWSGLAPSEALEIPLALDAWEPDDLVAEGGLADAFAHYVPRQRVAWFHFGRRVYALTARIKGRWRWSYQTIGFDAFGAVTLFDTTEEKLPPEGYPSCDAIEPAGTFADITVGNHLQGGDETIEVWVRPYTGEAEEITTGEPQEVGGLWRGLTNFEEFPAGDPEALPPAGMTAFGASAGDPATYQIIDDPVEGHYLAMNGQDTSAWAVGIDAFAGLIGDQPLEMLARVYINTNVTANRRIIGPAWSIDGATLAELDFDGHNIYKRATNDFESTGVACLDGAGGVYVQSDILASPEATGWWWVKIRRTVDAVAPINPAQDEIRVKSWQGTLLDEPVAWDGTGLNLTTLRTLAGVGFGIIAVGNADEQRISFLSFNEDLTEGAPVPEQGESTLAPAAWFLARSVAVTNASQQVVRITGLEAGKPYDVALRYRRGLLYNVGAENTADPTTWPSVSRCSFETIIDPPTIESAVWERTSGVAERIQLTITPVDPNFDIEVWVAGNQAGPYTLLDTIAAPHAGSPITYDHDISVGEAEYWYKALTVSPAGDSPLSEEVFCWAGPAAELTITSHFFISGNYIVGFTRTGPVPDEIELWDNVTPSTFAIGGFELAATVAGTATEADPDVTIGFNEVDEVDFSAYVVAKETAFGVDDFGQISNVRNMHWPE